MRVTLVTCAAWPELSASDRRYADALERFGVDVQGAPWNGPPEPFDGADLVVLRASWDYHHDLAGFVAWLDALERRGTRVLNPPPMVRWNLDKRYLLDLARRGIRVPETEVVPADPAAVAAAFDRRGWETAVVKPLVGASGHGVRLLRAGEHAALEGTTASHPDGLLMQEFLPEIVQDGEASLVFFDGACSHAALKRPAAGDFRVNSDYQGTVEPFQPDTDLVRQAQAALDTLDEIPLYARVDVVVRAGESIVVELELNEPALFLTMAPDAAVRFAEATMRRLAS